MSDNDRRAEIEARLTKGYVPFAGGDRFIAMDFAEDDVSWALDRIAALTAERDAARADGMRAAAGMVEAQAERFAALCPGPLRDVSRRIREVAALAAPAPDGVLEHAAAMQADFVARFPEPTPAPDGAGDRDATRAGALEEAAALVEEYGRALERTAGSSEPRRLGDFLANRIRTLAFGEPHPEVDEMRRRSAAREERE